jgi:cytochrome c553
MNPREKHSLGLLAIWSKMGTILCCVLLVSFALTKLMSRVDRILVTADRQEMFAVTSAGTACGSCHAPKTRSVGATRY